MLGVTCNGDAEFGWTKKPSLSEASKIIASGCRNKNIFVIQQSWEVWTGVSLLQWRCCFWYGEFDSALWCAKLHPSSTRAASFQWQYTTNFFCLCSSTFPCKYRFLESTCLVAYIHEGIAFAIAMEQSDLCLPGSNRNNFQLSWFSSTLSACRI